jgi:hypothetical protein
MEDGAKRENVRAGIGLLTRELLRRHILKGADNRAFRGQWRGLRGVIEVRNGSHLGQSKVEQFRS